MEQQYQKEKNSQERELNQLKKKMKFDEVHQLKRVRISFYKFVQMHHNATTSEKEANEAFRSIMNEQDLNYKREKRTNILQEKNSSLAKRLSKKQHEDQRTRNDYVDKQHTFNVTSDLNKTRIR